MDQSDYPAVVSSLSVSQSAVRECNFAQINDGSRSCGSNGVMGTDTGREDGERVTETYRELNSSEAV